MGSLSPGPLGCPQTSRPRLLRWPPVCLSGSSLLLFPALFLSLHLSFTPLPPRSCSQLERGSGSWTGSPLQRTLSFLLGMTGKAKVGDAGEAGGLVLLALPAPLPPHPPSSPLPSLPGDRHQGRGSQASCPRLPPCTQGISQLSWDLPRPPHSAASFSCGQLEEGKGRSFRG